MMHRFRFRRGRPGFTLVELLITVTIVGLLARIALPKVSQFRLRARATSIVNDMEVIRLAAFGVAADSGYWPPATAAGTRPTSMESYLPPSLSFNPAPGVNLEWRMTGIPNGDVGQAQAGATMGMGADIADDELRVELQRALAAHETLTAGTTVFWLIWGPTARP
jgi:prepilin-type N-terminal cleavage/methylation domain-containing protein